MEKHGFLVIQWNTDSNDWKYVDLSVDERATKSLKNIDDGIKPKKPAKDNFITLQHDINDVSVEIVPKIILDFKKAGYKFTTVANCLKNKVPPYKNVPAKAAKAVEAKGNIGKFAKLPVKVKSPKQNKPTGTHVQSDKGKK